MSWELLEKYKEFITNGLDLLSFLIITPEIFRLVRPALVRFVPPIYAALITAVFYYQIYSIVREVVIEGGVGGWIALILTAPFVLFVAYKGATSLLRMIKDSPAVERWMNNYSFLLGVLMFLVSRIIAFVVAAHHLATFP
jgi:hypothetical protein